MNSIIARFAGALCFALVIMGVFAPVANAGTVLGIPEGVYEGDGELISQTALVPNLQFHSRRTLEGDVITAETVAQLASVPVARASAHLRVVSGESGSFELLDLDSLDASGAPTQAGGGRCASDQCTFNATVMGGRLTLNETWTATIEGFKIVNGSQDFEGKKATYEAPLLLVGPVTQP